MHLICLLKPRKTYIRSQFLAGESGIEMLESWLDTISASASNTSLIIVGTHLDKVKENKEPGFQEHMRELVRKLVALPKYNRINVQDIKEVSCAPDNREGMSTAIRRFS